MEILLKFYTEEKKGFIKNIMDEIITKFNINNQFIGEYGRVIQPSELHKRWIKEMSNKWVYDHSNRCYQIESPKDLEWSFSKNDDVWGAIDLNRLGVHKIETYLKHKNFPMYSTDKILKVKDLRGNYLQIDNLDGAIEQAEMYVGFDSGNGYTEERNLYWIDLLAKLKEIKLG